MPSSSLLLPVGIEAEYRGVLDQDPAVGQLEKDRVCPMPSPLVALPTSVAKPVCWQKRAKDSEAE